MNASTDHAGGEDLGGKAFILSLQPGFADAEDVLQETFFVVTRRAEELWKLHKQGHP